MYVYVYIYIYIYTHIIQSHVCYIMPCHVIVHDSISTYTILYCDIT